MATMSRPRAVFSAVKQGLSSRLHRSSADLPDDLLRRACRRLTSLALALAAVMALESVLSLVGHPILGFLREGARGPIGLSLLGVLASLVVAATLRLERIPPRTRLTGGLVFELGLCFGTGVYRHYQPYRPGEPVVGFSPNDLYVTLFAAIIPAPTWQTALAALGSVLSDRLALWLLSALHGQPVPALLPVAVPGLFAAALAILISRFIHDYGQAVREARQVGSYELVERLGAGGMGEVWRARHRLLVRPAAVKLIRPEALGDPAQAARSIQLFEREAQAAASLRCEHTIEVFDFGVAADGTFYYVMELLEGMDLELMVRQHGPLPPGRVARILVQVCRSLDEAHARGVVHRDIKPANIHVGVKGLSFDFVKVLDFGLVKNTAAEAQVSAEEAVAGTPGFLAPEAVRGQPVDARADLYALGCVAYYALVGELVFGGAPLAVALAHVEQPPPPPSARTAAAIPAPLEAVVLRCLEKDPAARFQTAAALAEALEATGCAALWSDADASAWWRTRLPPAGPPPGAPLETTLPPLDR